MSLPADPAAVAALELPPIRRASPAPAANDDGVPREIADALVSALACPSPGVEGAGKLAQLEAEVERLRAALIQAGRSVGAHLADDVSTAFLLLVPAEVRLVTARLTRERDEARADLAEATSRASAREAELLEQLTEARLTLAVEQRDPSGAPEGWVYGGDAWSRSTPTHFRFARWTLLRGRTAWEWLVSERPIGTTGLAMVVAEGCAPTARAAMLAADGASL